MSETTEITTPEPEPEVVEKEVAPKDLSEEQLVDEIDSRAASAATQRMNDDLGVEESVEEEVPAESAEAETTPEPEADGSAIGVSADPVPQEGDRSLEDAEKELEEAKKQTEHFHRISGREAGRAGHLEQQLRQLNEQLAEIKAAGAAPQDSVDTGYEPEVRQGKQAVAQAVRPLEDGLATVNTYLTQQAIKDAGLEWNALHPEADDIGPEVAERITKEHKSDLEALLVAADPIAARQKTSEIINSAYWHVREGKLSAEVEERKGREADQSDTLRTRKLAAAPASAGGDKAAPRPKPKTLDTAEDIGKEIDRRARAARR